MVEELPIVATISDYLDPRSQGIFTLTYTQACRMIGLERQCCSMLVSSIEFKVTNVSVFDLVMHLLLFPGGFSPLFIHAHNFKKDVLVVRGTPLDRNQSMSFLVDLFGYDPRIVCDDMIDLRLALINLCSALPNLSRSLQWHQHPAFD
jgi:hypothetical protein